MKRTVDDLNQAHFPASGGILWPDSPADRTDLARKVFGIGFVRAHDYWIARAEEIVKGENELAPAYQKEQRIRQELSSLSSEQIEAALQLVAISVHGALFSALTSIDQFPRADLVIDVDDPTQSDRIPLAPTGDDLHDEFFDWLSQFSSCGGAA